MNGLTNKEVISSREKFGTNKLPEAKQKTAFQFFMETFKDRLNQILLAMMIVFTVIAVMGQGSFSEPAGVFIVLLAIAAIGTKTGLKSQKSEKELRDRTSVHYCNVIRDGNVQHINTDELVVGDVVIIQSGEGIYADGYLIEGSIKVDNSVLNGESEECKKTAYSGSELPYDPATRIATGNDYVDEHSLFSGAIITEGEGKMFVTNVGIGTDNYPGTVNGKTISQVRDIEQRKTSLEIQLEELAGQISKFGYAGAAIIIVALIVTNILKYGGLGGSTIDIVKNILTIAVTALTIIVAAVPEGLPLIINLITAQNAKVMIKNNVLAKNTNKIPEAGNIDLLCTDKTGTLTKGVLTPVYNIMGNGHPIAYAQMLIKNLFAMNAILNNDSMYDDKGEIVGGNATDRAVLSMFDINSYNDVKSTYSVKSHRPFNSAYKFSAVETEYEGELITLYKGAPERFINSASSVLIDDTIHEIDKDYLMSKIEEFTSKAMRVIATGYSLEPIDFDSSELPNDLVITSLIAIRDDVRPEVPEAVKQMHEAGVQVMMITGDVINTAKAIAVDAGLITSENDLAYTASEIDAMSDDELKDKLSRIKVIARATPDTKLRIVQVAQSLNRCVGMTGK